MCKLLWWPDVPSQMDYKIRLKSTISGLIYIWPMYIVRLYSHFSTTISAYATWRYLIGQRQNCIRLSQPIQTGYNIYPPPPLATYNPHIIHPNSLCFFVSLHLLPLSSRCPHWREWPPHIRNFENSHPISTYRQSLDKNSEKPAGPSNLRFSRFNPPSLRHRREGPLFAHPVNHTIENTLYIKAL